MSNLPKVSIIIPTYNRPDLIRRAVESVLKQTYQNFEIVIIDDTPNDKTEKVVKNFNDKRIKYIRNQIRKGPSAARNQGIKESSKDSRYIAFLDDDDEYLPLFLEKTMRKLEEKEDIIMVATDAELRSYDEEFIREMHWNFNKEFWKQAIGNGCVVRRKIFFEENMWYDENLVLLEDVDIALRGLKNHKWDFVPEILRIYYTYPSDKGTTLSTLPQTLINDIEYFLRKNYSVYKQAGGKALGWLHFYIGKWFCRIGKSKEGRGYLLKAFKFYPRIEVLVYYLLALLFPKTYQNSSLAVLKHKIFGIFRK